MLALAACTEPTKEDQLDDAFGIKRPVAPQGDCPFEKVQPYVGQHVSALEKVMLLGQVRVIRPNTMVTMDYLPTRLNINLNKDDVITRLNCG